MAFYNHVTLMGNLTKDPELRYIPSGAAVCDFGLGSVVANGQFPTILDS